MRIMTALIVAVAVGGVITAGVGAPAGASVASGFGFDPAVYVASQAPGPVIGFGSSSAIGDVSGDGRADLVVTSNGVTAKYSEEVLVYKQTASHGLSKATVYPLPAENVTTDRDQAFLLDMNGDGRTDVVVAVVGGVDVLLQGAHGGLRAAVRVSTIGGSVQTVADLDGDGHPDIVAMVASTNGSGVEFQIFWGKSATTFAPGQVVDLPSPTGASIPTGVRTGDLNGDHRLDIIVTGGNLWTSLQTGSRTFSTPKTSYTVVDQNGQLTSSLGADVGDVNGDGLADVVLSAGSAQADVFYGQANGTLSAPRVVFAGINPTGVTIGDLTGDGRNEIAVMNDGWNSVTTIIQQADGSLAAAARYVPVKYPQFEQFGVSIGDLNGDSLADITVMGSYQAVVYQTNPRPVPVLVGGNVTLSGPSAAKAGVAFSVAGNSTYQPQSAACCFNPPFSGQTMIVQTAKTATGPWTTLTRAGTDNLGNFTTSIKFNTSAYIQVVYPGNTTMYPMSTPPIYVKVS